MRCEWCKVALQNSYTVMADGEIWCQDCGRLRSDMKTRSGMYFMLACEQIEERRNKYGT